MHVLLLNNIVKMIFLLLPPYKSNIICNKYESDNCCQQIYTAHCPMLETLINTYLHSIFSAFSGYIDVILKAIDHSHYCIMHMAL